LKQQPTLNSYESRSSNRSSTVAAPAASDNQLQIQELQQQLHAVREQLDSANSQLEVMNQRLKRAETEVRKLNNSVFIHVLQAERWKSAETRAMADYEQAMQQSDKFSSYAKLLEAEVQALKQEIEQSTQVRS